jgi:hypothetical protein
MADYSTIHVGSGRGTIYMAGKMNVPWGVRVRSVDLNGPPYPWTQLGRLGIAYHKVPVSAQTPDGFQLVVDFETEVGNPWYVVFRWQDGATIRFTKFVQDGPLNVFYYDFWSDEDYPTFRNGPDGELILPPNAKEYSPVEDCGVD